MDEVVREITGRILFLALWILLAGGGSLYYYLRPEFVDRPNNGWFGRLTRNPPEEKDERYEKIRKRLLWNIPIVVLAFAFLLKDIYLLLSIYLSR